MNPPQQHEISMLFVSMFQQQQQTAESQSTAFSDLPQKVLLGEAAASTGEGGEGRGNSGGN